LSHKYIKVSKGFWNKNTFCLHDNICIRIGCSKIEESNNYKGFSTMKSYNILSIMSKIENNRYENP